MYSLFTNPSVAHTLLIYCIIIVVGMLLGKIRIRGISLGATFVLFTGIALGHFNLLIDADILDLLKNFGLTLFIFSIGLQVGPSFFSSFKKGGMQLNGLAVAELLIGIAVTISLYYIFQSRISMPMMVGIMSGAVTCTPGLGAAEEALQLVGTTDEHISLGYAVAYPMAILGTILAMFVIRYMFNIDPQEEESSLKNKLKNSEDEPDILTFRITHSDIDSLTIAQLKQRFGHQLIITRVNDGNRVFIPHADTMLHVGYIILVVTRDANALNLQTMLGERIDDYEWKDDEKELVSRRIVVTQNDINGKTIGQLHLRSALGVNITRINRAGVNLLAQPELTLQVGDRVMVVGPIEGIRKTENMLGNALKKLNEPHIVTIFLGILCGILVGSIPIYIPSMPMPARLGLVGGSLIVAILLGRFGYKLHIITYTTISANLMLREIGLCLFLASVGIEAGAKFVETVISPDGLLWLVIGSIITFLPALIIGIAARLMKINFFTICGLIAGAHTNAPSMAYANSIAETDEPAVAYSTVYPLITFLRIIAAQLLILLWA